MCEICINNYHLGRKTCPKIFLSVWWIEAVVGHLSWAFDVPSYQNYLGTPCPTTCREVQVSKYFAVVKVFFKMAAPMPVIISPWQRYRYTTCDPACFAVKSPGIIPLIFPVIYRTINSICLFTRFATLLRLFDCAWWLQRLLWLPRKIIKINSDTPRVWILARLHYSVWSYFVFVFLHQ